MTCGIHKRAQFTRNHAQGFCHRLRVQLRRGQNTRTVSDAFILLCNKQRIHPRIAAVRFRTTDNQLILRPTAFFFVFSHANDDHFCAHLVCDSLKRTIKRPRSPAFSQHVIDAGQQCGLVQREQLRIRIIRRCHDTDNAGINIINRCYQVGTFRDTGTMKTSFTHSFSPLYPLNDSATIITHHARNLTPAPFSRHGDNKSSNPSARTCDHAAQGGSR